MRYQAYWIQGFMGIRAIRRTRSVMLMVLGGLSPVSGTVLPDCTVNYAGLRPGCMKRGFES